MGRSNPGATDRLRARYPVARSRAARSSKERSMPESIRIADLMESSGVKFGTSGARGLVRQMTDRVCYAYTTGFLQYLEAEHESHGANPKVAIAGDLRPSTDRIIAAVAKAVTDRGYEACCCGKIPSPAVALHGLQEAIPAVMVTGSHIPADRNGIKYNTAAGEIMKRDEAGIKAQVVTLPEGLFDNEGRLTCDAEHICTYQIHSEAAARYIQRYLNAFPANCLAGKRIGLYEHSAVGREVLHEILVGLGAEVERLGFSGSFVPVDTEAIRPEDVALAAEWAKENDFHAILSTDGDSDRPLIADETGRWLRGDVAGILCAQYLGADAVVTPVSCNTAVEACGAFPRVIRTRIGSPYVIEAMQAAVAEGATKVVGYEANGGFLTASDIPIPGGKVLEALPTRDATVLLLSILLRAETRGLPLSALVAELPERYTYSNRLKDFPTEKSGAKLTELRGASDAEAASNMAQAFDLDLGGVAAIDQTDGLRATFANGEVIHLRPSGNAPEFRCYTEAGSAERAQALNEAVLAVMEDWK